MLRWHGEEFRVLGLTLSRTVKVGFASLCARTCRHIRNREGAILSPADPKIEIFVIWTHLHLHLAPDWFP